MVLFGVVPVVSAAEFDLSLDAAYQISGPRQVRVEQVITITNATASAFPKQVSVVVPVSAIESLRVISQDAIVPVEQVSKANGTVLGIDLSSLTPVIGKTRSQTIRLEYGAPALSYGSQKVLDVFIPQADSGLSSNRLSLQVPVEYGPPVILSKEASISASSGQVVIEDYDDATGLYVGYGQSRVVTLEMTRTLTNTSSTQGLFQVPLPPTTQSQRVVITSLTPMPTRTSLDIDGNTLADYILNPNETVVVTLQAQVELTRTPRTFFAPAREQTIAASGYWTVHAPEIQGAAKTFSTVVDIARFLSDRFDFAYVRRERQPASQLLKSAVDLDAYNATDLTVSLLRAKQIPSRLHYGLVVGSDPQFRPVAEPESGIHTYVEYFDVGTDRWLLLDPSWWLTNGAPATGHLASLSHLSLMINGHSSTLPELPPAGTYTISARDQEEPLALPETSLQAEILVAPWTRVGLLSVGTLIISNPTGMTLDSLRLESSSHRVNLLIPPIPPYGHYNHSIALVPERWFKQTPVSMLVYAGDQEFSVQSKVSFNPNLIRLIVLVLAAAGTTGAIVAGSVLVYRFRRRRAVRRKGK